MELEEVMKELEKQGDAQTRKVWARHGNAGKHFGVSIAKLTALKKLIGRDHDLAGKLWDSGYLDARILATMIEEKKKVTRDQIESWVKEIEFWDLSGILSKNVVMETPFAVDLMREWVESENDYIRRAGYDLLSLLAMRNDDPAPEELESFLTRIEADIHDEVDRLKQTKAGTVIAIGTRNRDLNEKAIATAERIGTVEASFGETACKIPDMLKQLNHPRIQKKLDQ